MKLLVQVQFPDARNRFFGRPGLLRLDEALRLVVAEAIQDRLPHSLNGNIPAVTVSVEP